MIIKKYPAPPIETAAERYDRDWLNIPDLDTEGFDDLRHDRTLLQQHIERKSRRYVDDGVSAVTGGSPVFDPNDGTTIPGEPEPAALWSESFTSELDSAWTSLGSYNPPGGRPINGGGEDIFEIVRPAGAQYFQLDFELDTPESVSGEDFFIAQVQIIAQSEIGYNYAFGTLEMSSTNPTGVVAFGHSIDGSSQEPMMKDPVPLSSNRMSMIHTAENTKIIIGDQVISSDHPINLADANIMLVLMTSVGGSFKSVSLSALSNNGGGTPEPEPEIPSEPEVPEGSYQEIYTETY